MNAQIQRPIRLRELIDIAAAYLDTLVDNPRGEAEGLWAHLEGVSRASLIAHDERPPTRSQIARAAALLRRRARGEPFAYLTGHKSFWTLDLEVSPDVLIPRSDTETLVEWALELLPPRGVSRIADLGTGSGAIALSIACERPGASVAATDISGPALSVAADNAARLELTQRVEFHLGDWCSALPGGDFDLIVSNPPYIAAGDPHLAALRFEPLNALVSGGGGLDAIRKIIRCVPKRLAQNGSVLIEHGADQGADVRALLEEAGLAQIQTRRDLENRERVSGGRRA